MILTLRTCLNNNVCCVSGGFGAGGDAGGTRPGFGGFGTNAGGGFGENNRVEPRYDSQGRVYYTSAKQCTRVDQ